MLATDLISIWLVQCKILFGITSAFERSENFYVPDPL